MSAQHRHHEKACRSGFVSGVGGTPMTDTHTIYIDHNEAGYSVSVVPPCPPFDFDLTRTDPLYVRTYARCVSKSRGWPVVDRTQEVAA